jgi:hypothetical protein
MITLTKDFSINRKGNRVINFQGTISLNPSSSDHSLKIAAANLKTPLVYINLNIANTNMNKYEFLQPKQIGLEVVEFYNYISKLPINNPLHKPLKGAAHALLCIMIKVLLNDKYIDQNTEVGLYAWGILNDKERIGLINYYKSIGFEVDHEIYEYDRFEEMIIEDQAIPMLTNVNKLIDKCFKKEVSPELERLLNTI